MTDPALTEALARQAYTLPTGEGLGSAALPEDMQVLHQSLITRLLALVDKLTSGMDKVEARRIRMELADDFERIGL
jgi:hypothetical protein